MTTQTQCINANEIAAIASAIAAIFSLFVGIYISKAQGKRDAESRKIAVFQSRYEIYSCFMKLFKYSSLVKQDSDDSSSRNEQLNYKYIFDQVANDFDILNGKNYRSEYNRWLRKVENGGDDGHKADLELYYLAEYAHKMIGELKENSILTIDKGMFFFDHEIITKMKSYVFEFFDYIAVFKDGTAMEFVRDSKKLEEAIADVKKHEVIKKMEKYLSIN